MGGLMRATPGVAGLAREDLEPELEVTLTAANGVGSYTWTLIDAPTSPNVDADSAAVLSATTGAAVTITPDFVGTYYGSVTDGKTTTEWSFYAGPPLGNIAGGEYFPRRVPAFREALAHNVPDAIDAAGNRKGWSREWRRWFAAIGNINARLIDLAASVGPRRVWAVALGPVDLGAAPPVDPAFYDDVDFDNDYTMLNLQTNPAENGIYLKMGAVWLQQYLFSDLPTGVQILVLQGTVYRGTQWQWTGVALKQFAWV